MYYLNTFIAMYAKYIIIFTVVMVMFTKYTIIYTVKNDVNALFKLQEILHILIVIFNCNCNLSEC